MRRAIEVSRESKSEERKTPPPVVGAVIVKDGELIAECHRGQTGEGDHAEYGALKILGDIDLSGAEVYTTLEPCSRRSEGKKPCAERLVERGISTVYIGIYDPNPDIYRAGWCVLRDGGVTLRDFDADLRYEVASLNESFVGQYRSGAGDEGEATFDYLQNNSEFAIQTSYGGFDTRWSRNGRDSIHAYGEVALARHAREFEEIDDPGAIESTFHGVTPKVGEIVVFVAADGFLLVQIMEVHSGAEYGSDHTSVTIRWQARERPWPSEE
jgi:diaminohydroxyphosphoribosylaminopyrimidine deaminase/5-amino-6-(5-phosphoribosylamino)uracil reductase